MTIDQRLEALTQSLELAAQMLRDNEARWEKRFGELEKAVVTLTDAMTVNVGIVNRVERKVEYLAEAMETLAKAQAVTEEKLQRFIDSLRRGGNGHT
jgi:hypothetical protein